jgi:hypothetical protein
MIAAFGPTFKHGTIILGDRAQLQRRAHVLVVARRRSNSVALVRLIVADPIPILSADETARLEALVDFSMKRGAQQAIGVDTDDQPHSDRPSIGLRTPSQAPQWRP